MHSGISICTLDVGIERHMAAIIGIIELKYEEDTLVAHT